MTIGAKKALSWVLQQRPPFCLDAKRFVFQFFVFFNLFHFLWTLICFIYLISKFTICFSSPHKKVSELKKLLETVTFHQPSLLFGCPFFLSRALVCWFILRLFMAAFFMGFDDVSSHSTFLMFWQLMYSWIRSQTIVHSLLWPEANFWFFAVTFLYFNSEANFSWIIICLCVFALFFGEPTSCQITIY